MKTAHQNVPTPQTSVDAANKSYVDTAVSGGASVAIGSTVSGGTAGSLLFVGTGPILAQNNNRLFWDNTNARLGIGTSLPGSILDLVGAGNTAAMSFFGGSSAAIGVTGTGRLRFNEITNKLQVSLNGGAYSDIATGSAIMSIGETVTSGTPGSVLFVGPGPVLAQDNANFFWDNTNKQLGVGTNNPNGSSMTGDLIARITRKTNPGHGFVLIEAGNLADAGLAFFTDTVGDDFAVFLDESDARKVKFATNVVDSDALRNSNTKLVLQQDGKFGIGNTAPTSLLHVNGDVAFGSTSAFSWVDSAKSLRITQSAPDPGDGTGAITLRNTLNTSLAQITWQDNAGTFHAALGYANTGGTQPMYWYLDDSGAGLGFQGPGGLSAQIYAGVANQAGFQLWNGGSLAVSAANTGRLIYNTTGQKAQWSFNGGSYFDAATYAAALTTGSVPFANASNQLAQDNANFFWDNTNKRLGIGNNAPSVALEVTGTTKTTGSGAVGLNVVTTFANDVTAWLRNHSVTGYSSTAFFDNSDVFQGYFGYSNASAAVGPGNFNFYAAAGKNWIFWNSVDNNAAITITPTAASGVSIQMANGSAASTSAANTGKLIYTTTGQKFQVSANGAAYLDVALLAAALTTGSIPFADASGHLAQNNADLNWNNTTNTLNVTGGGTTAFALDIHGTDTSGNQNTVRIANNAGSFGLPVLQFDNASTLVGAIIGDNAAGFGLAKGLSLTVPAGYNVGVRIGSSVSTSQVVQFDTTNSYIFSNLSVGHQNNPANALDVRISASGGGVQSIQNTSATGFSDILFYNESRVLKGAIGYANASETAVSSAAGFNIIYTEGVTPADWAMINGTANKAEFQFGMTDGSTFMQMQNGSGAAVSAANTGRVRYNTTGQKAQWSFNGGSYFDVATYAAALTTGSVLFANGSNQLAQDNANFFWDSVNVRLGIGTASPSVKLHVKASTTALFSARFEHSNTGGYAGVEFYDSTPVQKGGVGYGNSAVTIAHLQSKLFFYSASPDILFANSTKAELTFGMTDGSTFIEQANGSSAAVSSANTGRLIYTTTGQKYQVSANGAAYLDVALLAAPLTTGSVPFADASGHLAQNNSKLFWDNTNFRLGIRTVSPVHALDIEGGSFAVKTHANYTGSQAIVTTVAVQTTSATPVATTFFTMADNTILGVEVEAIGRDEAGVERAWIGRGALAYRQGGGATIQGAVQPMHTDVHTNVAMDVTITVSTNDVQVQFTGLAATTIDWVAIVHYQVVATSA